MSLHQATRPRDYRWELIFIERTATGTLIAQDKYGQRWESTRRRRYNGQGWICGHENERYEIRDSRYNRTTIGTHWPGHSRYWLRRTKARGVSSPTMLCELTATLSPHDERQTITPTALTTRTA